MKSKMFISLASIILFTACIFAAGTISDNAAIKKIKTIPMSRERYLEMKNELEKRGHYFFWDHGIALVITNAPPEVAPPPKFTPQPGSCGMPIRQNKHLPEPLPYAGQSF